MCLDSAQAKTLPGLGDLPAVSPQLAEGLRAFDYLPGTPRQREQCWGSGAVSTEQRATGVFGAAVIASYEGCGVALYGAQQLRQATDGCDPAAVVMAPFGVTDDGK